MHVFYFYLITGILLIGLEMLSNTFYLLVIGVSAILASLSALIFHNWTLPTLLMGILSITACILVKIYKPKNTKNSGLLVNHLGQEVEIIEIDQNTNTLKVRYSGSYWNAKLKDTTLLNNINIGQKFKITKFHNNQLEIDSL